MCEGFSPEHRELQEVTHPPGCGHSLFSGSDREPCLHDFPRQKQECGLDSLGSWGGCAGTAELVVKPCGRFRTPKGSSLSCPGPAVLTAFPVWDMQPGVQWVCTGKLWVSCSQFDHPGAVHNHHGLVFLAFLLLGAGGVMAPVVVQGINKSVKQLKWLIDWPLPGLCAAMQGTWNSRPAAGWR